MPKASTRKSKGTPKAAKSPRKVAKTASKTRRAQGWTFLSNHAHVMICLAQDPAIRVRDMARRIGITERAVLKILAALVEEGLVERHRQGRRNYYELDTDMPLRHPIENHHTVGELIDLILS